MTIRICKKGMRFNLKGTRSHLMVLVGISRRRGSISRAKARQLMEKQAFGQKNCQKRHFFGFFALGFEIRGRGFELGGQEVGSQGQDFALGGQVVGSHWMNIVINSIGVALATNYSIGFLWPPLVQRGMIICIKADSHLINNEKLFLCS